MKDLNRIKPVLVEKKKRGNGWQSNLARILARFLSGAPTRRSQIFILQNKYPLYWKLTKKIY